METIKLASLQTINLFIIQDKRDELKLIIIFFFTFLSVYCSANTFCLTTKKWFEFLRQQQVQLETGML